MLRAILRHQIKHFTPHLYRDIGSRHIDIGVPDGAWVALQMLGMS